MMSNLRGRTYKDTLEELSMSSLVVMRFRGDTHKIISGKDLDTLFDMVVDGPGVRQSCNRRFSCNRKDGTTLTALTF